MRDEKESGSSDVMDRLTSRKVEGSTRESIRSLGRHAVVEVADVTDAVAGVEVGTWQAGIADEAGLTGWGLFNLPASPPGHRAQPVDEIPNHLPPSFEYSRRLAL